MNPGNEPSGRKGADPRRLFISLFIACFLAFIGYLAAPADWVPGAGTVSLRLRDEMLIDQPLTIGEVDDVSLHSSTGSIAADLTFPKGVPLDQPVVAFIEIFQDGERVMDTPSDLGLMLTLADGREEPIPVTQWNDGEQRLEAIRNPTRSARIVLALLGFVVVMWVSEAVPLFVTALLIPVVLVLTGTASATGATAPFANPIIVLFFAGFLLAEAMKRTDLDGYISMAITARAGNSAKRLFAIMLALAAFFSMWMSNTAAAAVLIPIAIAVTTPLDHPGFSRALVLGIAYAATIGGVGSAIGTPANQLAIEFLGDFGNRPISFVEWFGFGLPMVVLLVPLMGWYLWRRSDVHVDPRLLGEVRAVAAQKKAVAGPFTKDQRIVLGVFVIILIGWLTETFHGIHPGIVALVGAVILFLLGRLGTDDLGRISWSALLTFGGGLTLGLAIVESGTSDYLAIQLGALASIPVMLAMLAVALITLLLTTVASNTASAAILIPLAIPLALVLGLNPVELVVVVAIASSIDFALVVGTPPTMIAYSTRLYTAGQILRTGILLDLVGIVILVFLVTRVWSLLGLT